MTKLQVYVGCGLKHTTPEFKEMIRLFKERLRTEISCINVLEFVTVLSVADAPDNKDIYHNDIYSCVLQADMLIADITYPSLGLGYELGTAIEKCQIPVFLCAKKNAEISRLILGSADFNSGVSICEYESDIGELFTFLEKEILLLNTQQQLKNGL